MNAYGRFDRFGNYVPLKLLALGGMASVFLARSADDSGSGRIVVLKRILPAVADNPEFLQQFKSEIRACAGLSHPNIVQIHDFGRVDGQPYIVMEYVDGKSVGELNARYAAIGRRTPPVALSATIAARAAEGLHYSHFAKNRVTDEPLNVIHRDISPQNILVAYDGTIRIIDFGIAKATSESRDKTCPGMIKGKIGYLSPEQICGQELDGRSDIFSLGVVLWEMLCGRRLFAKEGAGDFATLNSIVNCAGAIPLPSELNPHVPPELDRIVLRALQPQRELRYATALELSSDLQQDVLARLPGFSNDSVAAEMRSIFTQEIQWEHQKIRELNAAAQIMVEEFPLALAETGSHGPVRPVRPPETLNEVPTRQLATARHLAPRKRVEFESRPWVSPAQDSHKILQAQSFVAKPSLRPRGVGHLRFLMLAFVASIGWSSWEGHTAGVHPSERGMRFALMAPPEQVGQAPRHRQVEGPVAFRKTSEDRPDQMLLRIRVQPVETSLPTRVYVNGKRLDGAEQAVEVFEGEKVAVRVERPTFKSYERELVIPAEGAWPRPDGVVRLNVHLMDRD